MNSIQLFAAFRPTSNSVVKRFAFSPADRIKLLNYQSKSLYGPVIKTKQPKRPKLTNTSNKQKEGSSSTHIKPVRTKPESNYDSEMYWMIGNKWNEIADTSVPKNFSKKRNVAPESTPTIGTKKSVKLIETVTTSVCETVKPTIIPKAIPLSEKQLTNVLKHPLHSDVLLSSPTDIRAPKLRYVPSVGRVLQYTMPEAARDALLNWKLGKIKELGEQGFADLQQSNLNSGAKFHSSLQQYFLNNEVPIDSSPVYKLWESVRGVLDTFTAMPVSVEKAVYHPTLQYKGICDCVSEVQNELTIIEWKKSERSKSTIDATYDAPLQLCAYLGAMNCIPEFQGRIRQGMVVVAYENGKQADVYKMDQVMLRKYWRVWVERLHEYWIRTRDGTLPDPI